MTADRHLSPAETARLLGVSVKALRLYEQHALVKPLRTSAGWRAMPNTPRMPSPSSAPRAPKSRGAKLSPSTISQN